jgi:hypothetical protein
MEKLCTNKNHSYKHNEQINKQNIDNSEFFFVKYVKIYYSLYNISKFFSIDFYQIHEVHAKDHSFLLCNTYPPEWTD